MQQLRQLSLYTGTAAGALAGRILGWTQIGYVEKSEYCREIIRRRIRDGWIGDAPIFEDVRDFPARKFQGVPDVISAGFPCQNFSHAGDQNTDDDRNMWPETLETIGTVHPPLVILENVANLVTGGHGYFGEVLGGLAENRYNAVWTCLPASDLGANHERERVWILAWRQGLADPDRKRLEKFYTSAVTGKLGQHTRGTPADGARSGLGVEPRPPGVADGVADRMDRTRAAGNGLVPQQMAVAFTMLTREVLRETKP